MDAFQPANPDLPPTGLPGWHALVEKYPWFHGEASYPIPAYSEFMPPPRLGLSAYGEVDDSLFSAEDPYGWQVSEIEEEYEIKPGIDHLTRQIMDHIIKLGQNKAEYTIAGHGSQNLLDNPYWPPELAAQAGHLLHERYVAFLPLALSKTQDDKGRVRWTFFGGSEQGPETVFWKGFYASPGQELPEEYALAFIQQLLASAYGDTASSQEQIYSSGFRILPDDAYMPFPGDAHHRLPFWTKPFLIDEQSSFENVRYLLTFRAFSRLPGEVKHLYLAGKLNLLPFPGSLVFWGMPTYQTLQKQLPLAFQIPLLRLVARHSGMNGIRVPQSGWMHEPHPGMHLGEIQAELLRHDFNRSHRWDRVQRDIDDLPANLRLEKVVKVLFSTNLDTLGLYDKPMARNCQLWTHDFNLLLDGPRASVDEVHSAEAVVGEGGLFGYRFHFPAMHVGRFEVYWHRLAVAYLSQRTGEVELLPDAPPGYLTAYREEAGGWDAPIELWPRLLRRQSYLSALRHFPTLHDHYSRQTTLNIISLLDTWQSAGKRLIPRSFARALLRIPENEALETWLDSLPARASEISQGYRIQEVVKTMLEPQEVMRGLPEAITYRQTSLRSFEQTYWNDILKLSQGDYLNKDNADCIQDPVTLGQLTHRQRDLDQLSDYLISHHRAAIIQAGMQGKALCGELPFHWRTDFDFPMFGGWKSNQEGQLYERDLLVVIPGKDRSQAVILADHYDTAYMEDLYDKSRGGTGARLSAAGSDDNYSATATLLQAAPIYLDLARQGRLERDIWLLHLTGEEFPADCLGARHFCQVLLEKTLKLRLDGDQEVDLSAVRLAGVFVMDMIAHNREIGQDIFQISPGKNPQSLFLAYQAHLANLIWNRETEHWQKQDERRGLGHGRRSSDGLTIPSIAAHPRLNGEVRAVHDPQSSLYNTDGQIFSDVGVPVVLFMENYDINRTGYHDTRDTMANIDLDYGAALAAIAIETVARMATLNQ